MNPLADKTVALLGLVAGLAVLFVVCATKPKEEEQFLTEGVDTRCEVGYRPYRGARRGMFLAEGDKIAVIAPSALPAREQTDAVVNGLRKWGYVPVEGKHVCAETRTLDDVMEDLAWALQDPGTKAIFCVRGGYGASEVADRLSLVLLIAPISSPAK